MRRNEFGFTLVELLIVVAIIGILAAIAVPQFQNALIRAKIARVQADFQSIRNALEMYRLENQNYPCFLAAYMDNWNILTTPIAFMSEIPYDAFQVMVEIGSNTVGIRTSYFYSAASGTKNYSWIRTNKDRFTIDNYILASSGPDLERGNYILFYPRSKYSVIYYDMSNGLRSVGDIIYETHPGLNDPSLPSSPGGG